MQIIKLIYDNEVSHSWATNLRKKRLSLFKSLIELIPSESNSSSLKILDVGGTQVFWEQVFWETVGLLKQTLKIAEITLLNVKPVSVTHSNFNSVAGDARNMKMFKNNQFDIVFSNSVIEHVGDYNVQRQMANEIRRVGKRYFVQTPYLYFPVEPHFVFPFFQFLPTAIKVGLVTNFALGFYPKITEQQTALEAVNSIKLLNKKEFITLFPNAKLYEEKIFGLTKSLIVYDGWENS
jgi:2-polyprenyl-3-methyl-5-hydroxy-6-metoxy-1,4-benzoquinol methylase